MSKISIILADAHYLIRIGLRCLIEEYKEFDIVGEAIDKDDLLEQLYEVRTDLVLVDYNQNGYFNADIVAKIKDVSPHTEVLVISADNNRENIYRILESGVNCFITKTCDEEEIISAIKAAAKRERFFCNKVLNYIMERSFPGDEENCTPTPLSERESQIVRLVAKGKVAKEIAGELNLSPHTVYTHRKNIMRKLGLGSTSELVIYAMKTGIITSAS
ncbi:MAG: response regulator transcription factor [Bacteroidota bacterium]